MPLSLLQDAGTPLPAPLPTLYEVLRFDEDATLNPLVTIQNGVQGITPLVETLVNR